MCSQISVQKPSKNEKMGPVFSPFAKTKGFDFSALKAWIIIHVEGGPPYEEDPKEAKSFSAEFYFPNGSSFLISKVIKQPVPGLTIVTYSSHRFVTNTTGWRKGCSSSRGTVLVSLMDLMGFRTKHL